MRGGACIPAAAGASQGRRSREACFQVGTPPCRRQVVVVAPGDLLAHAAALRKSKRGVPSHGPSCRSKHQTGILESVYNHSDPDHLSGDAQLDLSIFAVQALGTSVPNSGAHLISTVSNWRLIMKKPHSHSPLLTITFFLSLDNETSGTRIFNHDHQDV